MIKFRQHFVSYTNVNNNAAINQLNKEYPALRLVLLLALVHGLVYVFLVPPWQHYDEPGHFEYAWLIANREGLPKEGDYDQGMRREVAASMMEHGFFRDITTRPNLLAQNEPVWIGIAQTGDAPLYYWLAALPLRLVKGTDVTFQLYLGRMVSLAMFLITIGAAYGAMREITPGGHPLRWLVPASMALLPGFVDLMTALNNDTAAVMAFTLFLWASFRLLRRGFSWKNTLLIAASAIICVPAKTTAAAAVPLAVVAGLLASKSVRNRPVFYTLITVFFLIGILFIIITWSGPDSWAGLGYKTQSARIPIFIREDLGTSAFSLPIDDNSRTELAQPFSITTSHKLNGKTLTIGAWIWISNSGEDSSTAQVRLPSLVTDQGEYSSSVLVSKEPRFYAFTFIASNEINRAILLLHPGYHVKDQVLMDGVVLAEGEFPPDQAPSFSTPDASQGVWGGKAFTNLVANPSAEKTGPRLRPWVRNPLRQMLRAEPSLVILSVTDPSSADWYYKLTAANMLRTFWAYFGWGNVPLLVFHRPYRILLIATLMGVAGILLAGWRQRRRLPWDLILLLGSALFIIWGQAMLRGIQSLISTVWIPAARYAYPAILPTMLVLVVGWRELYCDLVFPLLLRLRALRPYLPYAGTALWGLFFLSLDIASVYSILQYFK